MLSKLKRKPKLKKSLFIKRKTPTPAMVKIEAYLTRNEMMGYEIWSEKPRLEPEGHFRLIDWKETRGAFYFRIPTLDAITMESPLYLHHGKMRRVWLHLNLTKRGRLTHDEKMQAADDKS